MSYGWGFVHFALLSASSGGNGNYFALQAINFFFYPAQGFMNALVYLRPNYLRWREAGDNRLQAIQHALFSLQAPPRRRRRQGRQPSPHHPLPQPQLQKPVQQHHHDITDSSTEMEGGHQRAVSLPKEGEDDDDDDDNDDDESSTSTGGDANGQD
jgi:hypothetical protein